MPGCNSPRRRMLREPPSFFDFRSTARHRSLPFFFFLNDPAPTDISTLPLHAALPICSRLDRIAGAYRILIQQVGQELRLLAAVAFLLTFLATRVVTHLLLDERGGGGLAVGSIHIQDRKSTRLNSSHLVISYAVFCLNK